MTDGKTVPATPQGYKASSIERIPIPARNTMSEAQRTAADAIIAGPRKAIFGPFIPLLQCPSLMEAIGKTGEVLRFRGTIPEHIRELVILAVARETSNQVEWQTHVPLALQAGISQDTVDTVVGGRRPKGLDAASETAIDFTCELMRNNGVSDATYADAVRAFSEAGVVELTALVGYFVMVCWIMNVAHTPGPAGTMTPPLSALPA